MIESGCTLLQLKGSVMLYKKLVLFFGVPLFGLVMSCSNQYHRPDHRSSLIWTECPEYLAADGSMECSTAEMPLDRLDPGKDSIDVLVMRAEGASRDKKGQVWFLMGGPGDSIATFAYPMKVWSQTHPQ